MNQKGLTEINGKLIPSNRPVHIEKYGLCFAMMLVVHRGWLNGKMVNGFRYYKLRASA